MWSVRLANANAVVFCGGCHRLFNWIFSQSVRESVLPERLAHREPPQYDMRIHGGLKRTAALSVPLGGWVGG